MDKNVKEKIIFDTDIGTDIDDAVCLAYLLSQPKCQLMGITTCGSDTFERAKMVSAMCKVANADIPIYPGTEFPLLTPVYSPGVPQAKKLVNWPHETNFPKGEAISFMQKIIHENPGEITLLAVGAMTNIALLFAVDPEIPSLLKGLVLMCGTFTHLGMEWGNLEYNAVCDPYATAMVYNADVKNHISIGIDVTKQVYMTKEEVDKKFTAKILQPVKDFAGIWFESIEKITFHDPLAAAVIFDEKICGYERGNVNVEITSPNLKGYTAYNRNENGKHKIALTVDKEKFINHYFDTVK